jgi:hypothetical protein
MTRVLSPGAKSDARAFGNSFPDTLAIDYPGQMATLARRIGHSVPTKTGFGV